MPVTELSGEEWDELMYRSWEVNPSSKEKVNEDLNNEQGTVDIAVDASKAANVSGKQIEKGAAELASGNQSYSVSQSVQPENQQVQTR